MPSIRSQIRIFSPTLATGRIATGFMLALLVTAGAFAAEPLCPTDLPMQLSLPVTRAAVAQDKAITIIALGSSSTEGSGASAPDRTYPARLAAQLHVSLPDDPITVLNRGVGGQVADDILARLDTDVLALKPTLVIWQIGTNEALRAMDPAEFDALLNEGLRRIATTGSDVVLMDYQISPRMPPEAQREVYGAIIAKEAKAHSVSLFSRAALMRSWEAADPNAIAEMIGPDGLHHSDRGYACLAASLDSAIVAAVVPHVSAVSVNLK
jgi:acyl-CoA thioesterase I